LALLAAPAGERASIGSGGLHAPAAPPAPARALDSLDVAQTCALLAHLGFEKMAAAGARQALLDADLPFLAEADLEEAYGIDLPPRRRRLLAQLHDFAAHGVPASTLADAEAARAAAGGAAAGGGGATGGAADAPSLRSAQPCVIFLHHHAGCRLDAIPLLRALLGVGASVLALDLGGHGQSEGEFVSLGWHERDDVADVLAFARAQVRDGAVCACGLGVGWVGWVGRAARGHRLGFGWALVGGGVAAVCRSRAS
jgi:hypothetical protein